MSSSFALPVVQSLSVDARSNALARQNDLLKPRGALGRLEELAVQYAAVAGHLVLPLEPKLALAVFAADHGVTIERISAYPAEVTAKMVEVMATGKAAISVLARSHGVALSVTNVGVVGDVAPFVPEVAIRYFDCRVAKGTRNFRHHPAMTADETSRAMGVGAREAKRLVSEGATVLGVGEVGIGNTTSAAALVCVLAEASVLDVVGRGTGIDDATLERKRQVVAAALERHAARTLAPLELLASVGGLELAAMVGFVLTAAEERRLVVLDGFLAGAAALVACSLVPACREFLVVSHESAEVGARAVSAKLGLEPLLHLGMRLGEGTGAVLAMSLIRDAVRLEREMGTFASVGLA